MRLFVLFICKLFLFMIILKVVGWLFGSLLVACSSLVVVKVVMVLLWMKVLLYSLCLFIW